MSRNSPKVLHPHRKEWLAPQYRLLRNDVTASVKANTTILVLMRTLVTKTPVSEQRLGVNSVHTKHEIGKDSYSPSLFTITVSIDACRPDALHLLAMLALRLARSDAVLFEEDVGGLRFCQRMYSWRQHTLVEYLT